MLLFLFKALGGRLRAGPRGCIPCSGVAAESFCQLVWSFVWFGWCQCHLWGTLPLPLHLPCIGQWEVLEPSPLGCLISFVGLTSSSLCPVLSLRNEIMVLPYAGMSVVKTNKRLRNANIRVMESIYIPQRGGLSGVYTLLYHAFFSPEKREDSTHCLQVAVRSLACVVLLNQKVIPQVGLAQYSLINLLMMPDRLSIFEDVQLLVRKLNLQLCHPCEKNTEKYI